MKENLPKNLNELYFRPEADESCQDVLAQLVEKISGSGAHESVKSSLPNGGMRVVTTVKDLDISLFYNPDTGVMKVFNPELAEQIEKVGQISELCLLAREQKNPPYSLSGLTLDELPAMLEAVRDHAHFMGKEPSDHSHEWKSDVEFSIDLDYDPQRKQGSPFRVSSSCVILCDNKIRSSLKSLMSLGIMDKNTASSLYKDFQGLMVSAKSFLIGGNPPESMEDFREKMAEGIGSAWLVTDIVPTREQAQEQAQQM